MTSYAVFDYAGIVAAIAGLVLGIKGAFHLSRLPRRSPKAPLVWETFAACLLLGVSNICAVLSEPLAEVTTSRIACQLLAATVFLGIAARSYLRSRRDDELGSAA
jgi:hypothetical protein